MIFFDFPEINDEKNLPIYLLTVGINEWQYHVINLTGDKFDRVLYSTKGQGTLVINGTTRIIEGKTAFFIPANCPFEYYSNGPVWDTRWVVFGGNACKQLLDTLGFVKPLVFEIKDVKYIDDCVRKMHEAIRSDRTFGNYRASGFVYEFLIELKRLYSKQFEGKQTNSIIIRAMDYIDNHFKEQITLDNLCEVTGVTKQHLCRLFNENLSCSPIEYLTKYRLDNAKQLLSYKDLPIECVALESGFTSISYFCKVFKKYEGMTALQFRNN